MWSDENSSSKLPIPKRTPITAPEHATPIPVIEKKERRLWSDGSAPTWREICDETSQHKHLPDTGIQVCFVNDDEEAKRLFDELFCSGCDVDEDKEARRLYDEYVKGVIEAEEKEEEDRMIVEEVKRLIAEEEAQSPLDEEAKHLFD